MQLKEIEKLAASVMEKAVDAKEVAGVNLLVLKDKAPVLSLQAGYADLENKVLMADDTIMRLYSMSKPVTAACMMVSRECFEKVAGFEEILRVALNDVDFCMKVQPYLRVVLHELAALRLLCYYQVRAYLRELPSLEIIEIAPG